MAKRRTPKQWHELVLQYQQSGLSVTQFCTKHQIGESNFYLKLNKFKSTSNSLSTFVAARADVLTSQAPIRMQFGQCQLHLDDATSATWLATLIKSLS